ncbi:MAG: hypothetical protein RBT69_07975 [Spirochaetia bacterium]|nr:hypothetical protein [Spirochaetia bacterium]
MKILNPKVTKRSKITALAILLYLTSFSYLFSDVNNDIARLYASAADSFYKENKTEDAEVFLNKSLLYDEHLSDSWYIKALINTETKSGVLDSINLLKRAITYRNWSIYSENNAFYKLGTLYCRIKDYERAISSLYVVRDEMIDNENFLDSYTLSLINRGYFKEAGDLLEYAIEKHPQNNLFIKRLSGIDKNFREKILLRILELNDLYKYDPDVILEITRLTDDAGIKKELIEKLTELQKESPELLVEKIAIAGKISISDIDTFTDLNGLSNYRNLKGIDSLIRDGEIRNYLMEKISLYTGIIVDDVNLDGINEKIMYMNNGLPQWYSEDNNQDNINDIFTGFEKNKPVFINIQDQMLVSYYDYPLVKTVIIFGIENNEIFTFNQRIASFDILSFSNLLISPALKTDPEEAFAKIKSKAENYRKSSKGDNLKVLTQYFKSERITNFETYDAAAAVISRGTIKDGNRLFQISDINQDNRFETKEIYKNGVLESIKYDGNNNGIFEFKIENRVKYWDINEDGIYDFREWRDEENRLRYSEFSTKLDGVYNFSARYKDNILTDVKKENAWINVIHDTENNLYWIGEKCANFPKKINIETEGTISCGKELVYIVKIGQNYFAEVITR